MSVTQITSETDFAKAISSANLVVIDYYADWCGPCRDIAPRIETLSRTYTQVSFYKVNVDNLRSVSGREGVTAMPTFKLYRNGLTLATIVGDFSKLVDQIDANAGPSAEELRQIAEAKSPYKHFPQEDYAFFDELTNLPKVLEKAVQLNTGFLASKDNAVKELALSTGEISSLKQLIATLQDVGSYHSSSFSKPEFAVLTKMMKWGVKDRFPVLDIIRLLVLHHQGSEYLADACTKNTEDNLFDVLVGSLLDETVTDLMANSLMMWRFYANAFRHTKLRGCLAGVLETIVGSALSIYNKQTRIEVRTAIATTLLNASITARANKDQATKSSLAKVLTEISNLPQIDPAILLRTLLALGTLAYRDDEVVGIVKSLNTTFLSFQTNEKNNALIVDLKSILKM